MEIHFKGALTRDDYRQLLIQNNAKYIRLIVFFGLFLLIISFLLLYPVIADPTALADTDWVMKRLLRNHSRFLSLHSCHHLSLVAFLPVI